MVHAGMGEPLLGLNEKRSETLRLPSPAPCLYTTAGGAGVRPTRYEIILPFCV